MLTILPMPLFALWTNPVMLGWLAAAAAPIVIHLLNKRRHRETPWAAMQYLLAAVRKNSRRILLEQWLLLAIRTLVVALVVLAVAEPVLQSVGLVASPGQPTHKVLVIDGSYSMAYKPSDKSRIDRARELAAQIVAESRQGDAFTLVLMADPPQVIVGSPSFSPADFLHEVESLQIRHGGADLAATLVKVEDLLAAAQREQSRLVHQEVFFLTDMGRNTWAADARSGEALAEFRNRSARLCREASVVVLDLGQSASENMAIVGLRSAEAQPLVRRDQAYEVEVRNLGRQPRTRQLVELWVDDRRVAEQLVDLDAGASATVVFSHCFEAPGDHVVEARLAGDLLDVDNRRFLAAPVKERLRALCVDGRPGGGDFKGATDYLTVALAPGAETEHRALVDVDVVSEGTLVSTDLRGYDCVFLCDLAQFTANEAELLQRYLARGGGVVVFLGDRVQADNYNRRLADLALGDNRLLPARLGELIEEPRYGLDPLDYRHPLVAAFRDQPQSGLLTTPVWKHYRLAIDDRSRAKIALALDGGDALVVEESIGRGRVVLVATSADVAWTALPILPSYLPLIQEVLQLAVGDRLRERNVLVGQAIGTAMPPGDRGVVEILLPGGNAAPAPVLAVAQDRRFSFADTNTSGVYAAAIGDALENRWLFAVNVNTAESDLARVDEAELAESVWPTLSFQHRTNWRNLDESPATEIIRRSSLHRWLLVAAFGLMVCESLLTWQSGRRAL